MEEQWNNGQIATVAYKLRVQEVVKPGMTILHAGCGWDKNDITRGFSSQCRVIGIDLDPNVAPRFHSEFYLASLNSLPFAEDTFDIVVSEYVLEHLAEPGAAFQELARVLKRNGAIIVLTPNMYSYKTLAARMTPHAFHILMGRVRYGRGHEADMYPTLYRANTATAIRKLAANAGLRIRSLVYLTNGPTWFARFPVIFGAANLFHHVIGKSAVLQKLRCAMIAELSKV